MTTDTSPALAIVTRLRRSGFVAYYAGGVVRDRFLGVPCKDIDIATSARPEQVRRLFERTIDVGARFGVTLVVLEGKPFEVTTFRTDGPYRDGRHPETVAFSTEQEDARRRDFTINGMFYDPVNGRVLDYVGGAQDLEAGIIRTIGEPEKRFQEDRLRMIRAVRFAARLGFAIDGPTWDAIASMAGQIVSVSKERIRDELLKILTEAGAAMGFRLLRESGLLIHILPDAQAMCGVEQPPQFHPEGDVWEHTLKMMEMMDNPTESLALAVLLHDVAKPATFKVRERIRFDGHDVLGARMADSILKDLRCSRKTRERVAALVRDHLKFLNVDKMRPAKLKRFLTADGFDEHLELHRLDCLASHGKLDKYDFCKDALSKLEPEEIRPPKLISGHDLIALGLKPGPQFAEILRAVEDGQLEGRIKTREQAIALVKSDFDAI